MAAITKGTQFRYGAEGITVSGVVINGFKSANSLGIRVEGKDEVGKVVSRRYDDTMTTISITGLITGALPALGTTLVVEGTTGIITKVDLDGKNDANTVVSIEAEASEYAV